MSWGNDRADDRPPYTRRPLSRRRRVPLTIRLLLAVILAVALAVGATYTLRTLNL